MGNTEIQSAKLTEASSVDTGPVALPYPIARLASEKISLSQLWTIYGQVEYETRKGINRNIMITNALDQRFQCRMSGI